jgi:hypothetical protein
MGPACVIKGLTGRSFSILIFGWSQVLIDLQPLVVLITGQGSLHGFSHTMLGATMLGIIAAVSGRYGAIMVLQWTRRSHYLPINWTTTWLSAGIGVYSHLALDSIMHADVRLWFPISSGLHSSYGLLSNAQLTQFCLWSGFLGLVLIMGLKADR